MTPENSPEKTMEQPMSKIGMGDIVAFEITDHACGMAGKYHGTVVWCNRDTVAIAVVGYSRLFSFYRHQFNGVLISSDEDNLSVLRAHAESIRQQLAAAKPAIDFCAGISSDELKGNSLTAYRNDAIEMFNELSERRKTKVVDDFTINQIRAENQSIREGLEKLKQDNSEIREVESLRQELEEAKKADAGKLDDIISRLRIAHLRPCKHTTPCSPHCTCVHGNSSIGCARCCAYGSEEQQKNAAERIAEAIDSHDSLRAELAKNQAAREWIEEWGPLILSSWFTAQAGDKFEDSLRTLIQPEEKK
jgi:hypothetical protein